MKKLSSAPPMQMREPNPFTGVRDSQSHEDYLWGMERYFFGVEVPKSKQVR